MSYENNLNHTGSLEDALTRLVISIAMEEEALANLMRAEADKTLAFVGKERELPTLPSSSEFIQFNQTVTKILDSILMAEWMLMKKFDSVMQFQYLIQPSGLNSNFKVNQADNDDSSSPNKQMNDKYNELEEVDF